MNRINTWTVAVGLLCAIAVSPVAVAQPTTQHELAGDANADVALGEVRKIDNEAGKVTLKHGPIKNLDMPGMTMVFLVKDKALLDSLQLGDKVKFKAISEGDKLIVTTIKSVK